MLTSGFSWAGFYVAVALTVPAAWLLLRLYRGAVDRAMRGPGRADATPVAVAAEPSATDELVIERIDASALSGRGASYRDPTRLAVAITAVSGVAFVLVVIAGWVSTLTGKAYPLWVAWWMVLHAWPVVLSSGLVAGASGTDWARLTGAYLAAVAAMSAVCLAVYRDLQFARVLSDAATVLPIAIPACALAYRRVRSVGLLVFAFLLALGVIGPPIAMSLLRLLATAWPLALLLQAFDDSTIAVGVVIAALLAASVLGYGGLRLIGALYRRKRLSDESLLLDALWALVAVSHLLLLVTQGESTSAAAWGAPLAAFAAYWACQRGLPKLLRQRLPEPAKAPLLLLLRVFALGRRSEPMFDVLASRWLRSGPIVFIAGPDLAAGTVPPSQFLQFISGRLSRQFLASPADVRRRADDLDVGRDPDGRYRVNQLFCAGDTWKDAVLALAQRSDVVLMDLRSFSSTNDGCIHELALLLHRVSVDRVLLVVDASTDEPFLQSTLQRLWHARLPASRHRALRIVHLGRSSPREMRAVARCLQALA